MVPGLRMEVSAKAIHVARSVGVHRDIVEMWEAVLKIATAMVVTGHQAPHPRATMPKVATKATIGGLLTAMVVIPSHRPARAVARVLIGTVVEMTAEILKAEATHLVVIATAAAVSVITGTMAGGTGECSEVVARKS
jgi:hypothetical protein